MAGLSNPSSGQIALSPDTDTVCTGSSITFSYPGTWDIYFWIFPGGSPGTSGSASPTVTFNSAGDVNVTLTTISFSPFSFGGDTRTLTIVDQPTGPTLNTQTPAGAPCEGELVSATFNPGTGGIDCSDEFRYSTRTGVTWSATQPYTAGQQISTAGVDEVIIEGRRANCDAGVGCTASAWTSLAQWTVGADVTAPVITTCATDKFFNAGPTCQVSVPDLTGEVVATDNCDPAPVVTQSPAAGSTIGDGITTVTLTVTDAAGNSVTCTADITVTDVTAPTITGCPTNTTVSADTSYCGAVVSWTAPVASDNCPGVVLTSSHNPGDTFPVGTTTVTYTATDGSGLTDICSFDITVDPASAPSISGPTQVCTPIQSTYAVTDPGSHTFLWTVTNGSIVGSNTGSSILVDWTGTVSGTVDVTITSGSGCTNSNSLTVDQYQTPTVGSITSGNALNRR